jgi:hypothetical protein
MVSIPAGLMDEDPCLRLSMHVFTSSKPAWVDLNDDLQKYDNGSLVSCRRILLPPPRLFYRACSTVYFTRHDLALLRPLRDLLTMYLAELILPEGPAVVIHRS